MLLLNNGLCFVMRLATKLDAVHLADTIAQKRKQSKHGTGEQVNRMDDLISRKAAIDAINHICPVDTEYDCTLLDRVDVRCVLLDLPSAQRWILVSEKPIPKGRVFVTYNDGDVDLLNQPTAYRQGDIVAWMPLPEPWKGEEDE